MSKRCIILSIDNDEIFAVAISHAFQQHGIDVQSFDNIDSFLARLNIRPVHICIVDYFLDNHLWNGLTLSARIKELYPKCEIIIISDTNNPKVIGQFAGMEGYHFVSKDADGGFLPALIKTTKEAMNKRPKWYIIVGDIIIGLFNHYILRK